MTVEEQRRIAFEAFQEYSRVWGRPKNEAYIVVTRAIEAAVVATKSVIGETA